ncbi:MAG: metal-binding protein [Cyclobacteriaceae bacterium]|nr:metal-binding protein [Cyclobacteriaceae bacterium]
MLIHDSLNNNELVAKIRRKEITMAGNRKLKIYGQLSCGSGKRMKKQNRVFFVSKTEALHNGYRPCAHCLQKQYQQWISLTRA